MTTADGTILGTTQIFGTAPRRTGFNVVLLAEGFRDAEQAAFTAAAQDFVTTLTTTPPMTGVLPAVNVFQVNVASTDSGADDPAAAGGTGATARTYFDASFGGAGIRRLLVCDQATALTVAAAQVPEFTVCLLIVNSLVYGGSGGTVGTYSLAPGATEIALHELGHTAFDLADEYDYLQGCGIDTDHDTHPGPEPTEPNVTTNIDPATLKWRHLVTPGTAVPTTQNPNCGQCDSQTSPVPVGTVGLFEGAHYYHCGAFRAEFQCRMRALGDPFCHVCAAVIASRMNLGEGTAAFDHFLPNGTGTEELARTTWTNNWTHFVPFTLAGEPHLLSYKRGVGTVAFDRFLPNGTGTEELARTTWTNNWTHFTPFMLAGQSHLLSYKQGVGTVAFDRFLPDGTGTEELARTTWTNNWTHFVPFTLGGHPHLLSYKRGVGTVAFDRFLPDGTGTEELARTTWTNNWTHFVPFTLAGEPHLLSYKQDVGTVAFDRFLPNGTGTEELARTTWTNNWTHFTPFMLAGQSHLLSYKG